ncbi:Vps54-like protein-domain-containing protein [Polychytrium aggregatum]|uniref:Vps54-like protein-domain-containing protein n=1 Tax=Polychytrium aggregatum TaxID=110093 RepID=UPI0022FE2AF9|nr:Vps54-like protein-domain-containing protein [Polychytrium aggregatum]KAI9203421.1 Vps54-like protein-domain-containing protein [Polychytrium aggregatum]
MSNSSFGSSQLPAGKSGQSGPPPQSSDSFTIRKSAISENPFEEVLNNEHPWSIGDMGQNAISGILNDPTVQAKSGAKPLKGMDTLPIIPQTLIRKVRTPEFDPYLKSISDVIDRYQYNRAIGLAVATEGNPVLGGSQQSQSMTDISTKLSEMGIQDSYKGRNDSARKKLASTNAPSLDLVPAQFFDGSFNLSNPHTWREVTEQADLTRATSTSSNEMVLTSHLLQDKLSSYLEIVEVHLLMEISQRSQSFFSALSNLQALHQETQSCVAEINDLRTKLKRLSADQVKKGLSVVQLKKRRGKLALLYSSIKLVSEVKQTQPMIQVLLGQGDYVSVLDLIEETSAMLKGSASPSPDTKADQLRVLGPGVQWMPKASNMPLSLDLRGVRSLANLYGQLSEMSRTISMLMESEFVSVLVSDLRETLRLIDPVSKISPRIKNAPIIHWISSILSGDPRQLSSVGGAADTAQNVPALLIWEDNLKLRMRPLVMGLLKMDRLPAAFQVYKTTIMAEIKAAMKQHYPAISPIYMEDKGSGKNRYAAETALARQLRAMSFDAFYGVLMNVYVSLLHVIQRTSIVHELTLVLLKEAQDSGIVIGTESLKLLDSEPSSKTPALGTPSKLLPQLSEDQDEFGSADDILQRQYSQLGTPDKDFASPVGRSSSGSAPSISTFTQLGQESSDVVFAISDLAHVRCAKLLSVRSEQNAQLNPKDFYRLFGATWEFIGGGEGLCGRMCFGLKGTMLSQASIAWAIAKAFLNHFHDERRKQITMLIDNEQWVQAEVAVDFQLLADQIVYSTASSAKTVSPSTAQSKLREQQSDEAFDSTDNIDIGADGEFDLSSGSSAAPAVAKQDNRKIVANGPKTLKYLILDNEKYYVVISVLLFLKMLTEYMACLDHIPSLTTDVLNRIVEILKLFNSRACQMILGAGAMRSAGLRNITARHMALTAQSIGVVTAIIPHLKTVVSGYLTAKQQVLLADFDRLLSDYREHQNGLYFKLVSLMTDRLEFHSKNLCSVNWDQPELRELASDHTDVTSVYMVALVKEIGTLHRVLIKLLRPEAIKMIFTQIFREYVIQLEDDLKKMDLFTSAGKNRLLIDIQYFIQNCSDLEGIDGPGNHLEVVVNNIKIKDRRAYVPTSSAPPSHGVRKQSADELSIRSVRVAGSGGYSQSQPQQQPQQQQTQPPAPGAPGKTTFATNFGMMLRNQNASIISKGNSNTGGGNTG